MDLKSLAKTRELPPFRFKLETKLTDITLASFRFLQGTEPLSGLLLRRRRLMHNPQTPTLKMGIAAVKNVSAPTYKTNVNTQSRDKG